MRRNLTLVVIGSAGFTLRQNKYVNMASRDKGHHKNLFYQPDIRLKNTHKIQKC
jgi:hypothetical protein